MPMRFNKSNSHFKVVSTGITEPPAGVVLTDAQKIELEGQRLKDLKAKNYLFQAIDRSILETIINKDSSKQIWDSLKKKYQGTARAKWVHLRTLRAEFESLRMKMGESVSAYFARTMAIANKRRIHGEQLEDVIIIEKILRSLTAKFNYIICAIEESRDIDTLSIDELESTLLVHKQKVIRQDKEEQALQAAANLKPTGGGKGGWKDKNGQNRLEEKVDDSQGKGKDYDGQNSTGHKPKSKDKSNVKCFRCQKYGHYRSECRTNLNKNRGEKSNFVEKEKEEISLLMACHTKEESHQNLCVGQLQEKGYEISIKVGVCRIHDENLGLIAQVKMTANRMFPLYLHHTAHSCFAANFKDTTWLWHFRYGHLSFGGLKTLQQKNMVVGLPQFEQPSQLCEECIFSKQHRDKFPKGKSWRTKKVLELVHSDLCGLIKPTSNGGKRYFISFIDDFSRKTWVYFLQEKSEAFTAFQMFKALVDREADSQIKILRTDRGGEFNSQEFGSFCENHGVRRQLTAAYTPQQNGVCERKNRTILNMVRSLLQRSGLPKSFWPEAVVWSVYILNKSPTIAVQNITPEEAWSGYFDGEIEENSQQLQPSIVSAPDLPQNRVSAETPPTTNELDEQVEAADSRSQRDRRRPAWMLDYEIDYCSCITKCMACFSTGREISILAWGATKRDDLIYTGNDRVMFEKFKESVMLEFDVTDLGLLHYFLGLEVIQSDAGNFICQKKYVEEILERFQMKNCNSVTTPIEKGLKLVKDLAGRIVDSTLYKQIVGSLMYLTATRPDIMHTVSSISRYMEHPREDHLLAAKRILRYLRGNDYAGDLDDRRSTSGYVFMFGSAAISWSSKKQPIGTLSTTEAEFVAAASCACQALWLRNILHELQFKQPESTQIFCDNSSTIKLSKNPFLARLDKK
ncbi:hypothetical protein KPL71_008429 [Citrus sinensis]|uniref:Uncharacterized protein n=1 Tax=Citrus sinensis TaxID=2711 RepID=A0ACB8M717_CITSI|nr:hypothetical protein KPL71_008429 [Citrus sinensis]